MQRLPFEVTTTNASADRKLSVPGLFRVFQDAAILDAENIGYNAYKTLGKGLLWVFSRVYVRFESMPEYLSNAVFETRPGPRKAFFFPRYAKVVSEEGKTLARISSIWALIHEDTRKIEMHPELDSVDQLEGDELELPGRVVSAPVTFHSRRTIKYSDLDINGHLNNVRYIEMLMDLHDVEFHKTHEIKELLIQYESEIKPGETVELMVDESLSYVRGIVDDRIAFEANMKFAPKNV